MLEHKSAEGPDIEKTHKMRVDEWIVLARTKLLNLKCKDAQSILMDMSAKLSSLRC